MADGTRKWMRSQSTIFNWIGFKNFSKYGFYIPYVYANSVKGFSSEERVEWLWKKMDKYKEAYFNFYKRLEAYKEDYVRMADPKNHGEGQPRFQQDWFPGLDAATAYGMVRLNKPNLIMEIGSGHSTRFLAQAIKDEGIACQLVSIDPQPRKSIDELCDKVHRYTVTDVDVSVFSELQAGDILFVDGSHIAMPGTDVDFLFNHVFPQLPKGVLVHIHDIFLPNGYPQDWDWRSYNEQNLLLGILSGGSRFEIVAPNAYMRRFHPKAVESLGLHLQPGSKETSFWVVVNDTLN